MANLYDPDRESVLDALLGPGPFWFDELGPILARARWSKLGFEYRLNKFNYGTTRVLERNPFAERRIIGHLPAPINRNKIAVEALPPGIVERYRAFGLEFYSASDFDPSLLDSLSRAIRILSVIPGASLAVSSVLSIVHILKPELPEYDVSYSEPCVPFSIFVGVAQGDLPHRDLRLAEGILHECMHLQLTLIEEQTPLLATETERHLSPWRQTLRPTRGVLHGLYVFRVIQDVFAELILHEGLADNERRYMSRRVDEINDEVAQLLDLSFSQDLTATGSALAKRLLVGNRSSARQLIGRKKSAN